MKGMEMDTDTMAKIWTATCEAVAEILTPVKIGTIRDMAMVSRADFDQAIIDMESLGLIVTIPEENQKTLTSADSYNAVLTGGEPRHLIMRLQ